MSSHPAIELGAAKRALTASPVSLLHLYGAKCLLRLIDMQAFCDGYGR